MIYLNLLFFYHNEVVLLEQLHNTGNITTCNIFTSLQTISLGTLLFTARNRTNTWNLVIGRKATTTFKQFLEALSGQQLTRKCNRYQFVAAHRNNTIVRTNLQGNISIFNQISHIQAIGNKIISLPTKPLTPYNIGDVVKYPVQYDWYDSIFSNYDKMEKTTTHSMHYFYFNY